MGAKRGHFATISVITSYDYIEGAMHGTLVNIPGAGIVDYMEFWSTSGTADTKYSMAINIDNGSGSVGARYVNSDELTSNDGGGAGWHAMTIPSRVTLPTAGGWWLSVGAEVVAGSESYGGYNSRTNSHPSINGAFINIEREFYQTGVAYANPLPATSPTGYQARGFLLRVYFYGRFTPASRLTATGRIASSGRPSATGRLSSW